MMCLSFPADTSSEPGVLGGSEASYILPAILVPVGILIVAALVLFIKRKPPKADER